MHFLILASTAAIFSTIALSVPPEATGMQTMIEPPHDAAISWLRLPGEAYNLRLSPTAKYAAFTDKRGCNLRVVNLQNRAVVTVTVNQVGASFFWMPHDHRIVFRELGGKNGKVETSLLQIYDVTQKIRNTIDRLDDGSGLLSFDPHDMRLHLLHPKGILTKKLEFPGHRLARWQQASKNTTGYWLATQKAMLWASQGGFALRTLPDDSSGVESFSISPDGNAVVWNTKNQFVYSSSRGDPPIAHGRGAHPNWHPTLSVFVMAAARQVGNKVVGYDLQMVDLQGSKRFLSATQYSDETWPQWFANGRTILFTKRGTTDLYLMDVSL